MFDIDITNIIDDTYDKKCSVFRPTAVDTQGLTDYENKLIYENISCSINLRGGTSGSVTDDFHTIDNTHILYTNPKYEVYAGDVVVCDGKTYIAGDGVRYELSHHQIPLTYKGVA